MSHSNHGGRSEINRAEVPAPKAKHQKAKPSKEEKEQQKAVAELVKEVLERIEKEEAKARKAKARRRKAKTKPKAKPKGKPKGKEFKPERTDIVHAPGIVAAYWANMLPSERPMLTRMAEKHGWSYKVETDGVSHWTVVTQPALTILV